MKEKKKKKKKGVLIAWTRCRRGEWRVRTTWHERLTGRFGREHR